MCARNVEIVSSWKLDSSSTFHCPSRDVLTIDAGGVPILPPTCTGMPLAFRICPVMAVVVVFPFEPVMPMISPFRNQLASSRSPITGTPRRRACSARSRSAGTPGESTTRSAPSNEAASWGWTETPNSTSFGLVTARLVHCRHPRSLFQQQLHGRDAAARHSDHDRSRTFHFHRSFSSQLQVVSANNASSRPAIQKRMITLDSAHPNCSK